MDRKIVLVRSPRELIDKDQIGLGWKGLRFCDFNSIEDLFKNGVENSRYKGNIGRKKNQIKRYYNLAKGDIVIVPATGSIVVAEVVGEKSFKEDAAVKYGENRINVSYFRDEKKNVFIPRKQLSTALQSRLKIQMSVANLSDFSEEIGRHVEALEKGETHTWKKATEDKEANALSCFKADLLKRIKQGDVGLEAGGYGLEKLVQELFEIEGYHAEIQAKNQSRGIDDVDIIATRVNGITLEAERFLIQVKHHKGTTGQKGLEQLIAHGIDRTDQEFRLTRKILITTAKFSDNLLNKAEENNIIAMDGNRFVDWLYDNIEALCSSTRIALGISSIPSLV